MADVKISGLPAATTPLAGTEVLPIVQSGATVKVANNDLRPKQIQSNATSGVLQVAGPAAASTRVMTTPDANFTVARTDAGQTFTGAQTFSSAPVMSALTASKGVFTDASKNLSSTGILGSDQGGTGNGFTKFSGPTTSEKTFTLPDANATLARTDAGQTFSAGQIFTGTVGVGGATPANTGSGITFPATQSASSDVNTLDDYEEGTFTPTVRGNATAGTATYTIQVGRYTKIGNRVLFNLTVEWSSGTGVGTMQVAGFPFTSINVTNNYNPLSVYAENMAISTNYFLVPVTLSNTTRINVLQNSIGPTQTSGTVTYATTGLLSISGQYETAT